MKNDLFEMLLRPKAVVFGVNGVMILNVEEMKEQIHSSVNSKICYSIPVFVKLMMNPFRWIQF